MPTTSGGWCMGSEGELLGLGRVADSGSTGISVPGVFALALGSEQTHQALSFELGSCETQIEARCEDTLKDCICRRLQQIA